MTGYVKILLKNFCVLDVNVDTPFVYAVCAWNVACNKIYVFFLSIFRNLWHLTGGYMLLLLVMCVSVCMCVECTFDVDISYMRYVGITGYSFYTVFVSVYALIFCLQIQIVTSVAIQVFFSLLLVMFICV